jgi:hypothetical protein
MTSFSSNTKVQRPVGVGGEVTIQPAESIHDPEASKTGRDLMALLHAKTGGERMLTRADFTPVDIREFLPDVMLLDLVFDAGGKVKDATVRLMGSGLSAFYGENTGGSVFDHPSSAGERAVYTAQQAVDQKTTMISRVLQDQPGKPHLDIRTLVIPIVDAEGYVMQALVHFQVYDRSGLPIFLG